MIRRGVPRHTPARRAPGAPALDAPGDNRQRVVQALGAGHQRPAAGRRLNVPDLGVVRMLGQEAWRSVEVLKSLAVIVAVLFTLGAQAAVVVSSKLSSESAMLGQMIRLMLNANGVPTIDRTRIGATPVVRKALLAGEIDLYVEYTGNAGFFFNDVERPGVEGPRQRATSWVRGSTTTANHIVWLTPAHASNAWALAVRGDVAAANHLRTMSDFGRWVAGGGQVVLACSAEFANAGTLRSLERTYGFTLRSDQLHRARRRRDLGHHRGRGGAHQRHQHGDGLRHRRRHRRGEPCDPGR